MWLINRDAAIRAFGSLAAEELITGKTEAKMPRLEGKLPRFAEGYQMALNDASCFLKRMPTIEAENVKHGRWIDGADSFGAKPGEYRLCSHCNTCFPRDDKIVPPQYWQCCPNCFTRMDGGIDK